MQFLPAAITYQNGDTLLMPLNKAYTAMKHYKRFVTALHRM